MSILIAEAILVAVMVISVFTDIRYGKIFNKVVLPCLPIGLAIWSIDSGLSGLGFCLLGIAVGAIALVITGVFGWMAPGDAKLIVATGALMGAYFTAATMLYGALVGGAIALAILAKKHLLRQWATGTAVALSARIPMPAAWINRAGYFPYSLAIASGALLAALFPLW